jgi:CheY-like chemotaxis protein
MRAMPFDPRRRSGAPPRARSGDPYPRLSLGLSLLPFARTIAMISPMNGSVLVVDDDAEFRGIARRLLATFGLDVAGEAESAEAAVTAAGTLRPDAVLVDVGLPDRDGVDLARELTALPWGPRVVLTSSDTEAATARDVEDSGALAFVPKVQLPNAALGELLGRITP